MTQNKYLRQILEKGFVQVTEVDNPKSFFPQITFYGESGRYLVTVSTEDDTASKLLHALKNLGHYSQLSQEALLICPVNGGTGVYFNLYHKDGKLLLVNRDAAANTVNAAIIISKEEAMAMIAMVVALH